MQKERARERIIMFLCFISLLLTPVLATSQSTAMRVSLNLKSATVKEFFDAVKVQTGLNFISKGVKGDGVTDAWDVVDVTINQLYLELPLMVGARIHTASNFDLLFKGGPYLAYGVGGKTKIDGVSEKADTFGDDGLKRFDAGLGLGVAFEFGNIVVGVETGTSFTKVASGVSAHNLSALATIGYKF